MTYRQIPFLGILLEFVKGTIRPGITVMIMVWDYAWFFSSTPWESPKANLLIVLNLIVMITWFGERAIANLMPLILKIFGVRNDGPPAPPVG